MVAYRIFPFDGQRQKKGPPNIVECPDDETAVLEARNRLHGRAAEVWDEGRLVAIITRTGKAIRLYR